MTRRGPRAQQPKPYVITTAWGTPHKPCPHDGAGFERHESSDNARYLLEVHLMAPTPSAPHTPRGAATRARAAQVGGIPAEMLLEESVSLETVGNAFYTRTIHTDVRGLRRLAVINNAFHMGRTRAVFDHVFSVPAHDGAPAAVYDLEYFEVDDALPPDVLAARRRKEAAATPKFAPGGPWRAQTRTLREMHEWVHMQNSAYAARRLFDERAPLADPELLKSY